MLELNRQKYQENPLRQKLLDTGEAYLEATNHWNDTFWGVCNNKGRNELGKVLMLVRQEFMR